MIVTSGYAKDHLDVLMDAAAAGEEVRIEREGSNRPFVLQAVPATVEAPISRAALLGSLKGQISYTEDWDSDEVNNEIADLFENSELFPVARDR